MNRADQLARLRSEASFDVAVIGGGATGLGVALDAATRGFRVVLAEATDFAKGTSSRATKLVHGGVRYLAQGNVSLVREALDERAKLLANAPHLAQPLAFVMPSYRWWERGLYGAGLALYDLLAGARSLGDTQFLSAAQTLSLLPSLRSQGLKGGVKYWDGQFDDARLAVALARTAERAGACVVNHCPVTALVREGGRLRGMVVRDAESGVSFTVRAPCVVNAAGVWVDAIRALDAEAGAQPRPATVARSQGVHLVVDRRFLAGEHALLVPRTADARVLFAVPWMGKTVLGTTDTPRADAPQEPTPFREEVDFILGEASRYLEQAPGRADVRSAWVGLRPLVKPAERDDAHTKSISREHAIRIGRSGLVTVTGGKWTTYRAMAEDVLDRCIDAKLLPRRDASGTSRWPLVGAPERAHARLTQSPGAHLYGTEAAMLEALPGATRWLWRQDSGGLSEAMVRFAARYEMARTVEDVLARRCRLLFLDAAQASTTADEVALLLREELGPGFDAASSAASFKALAAQYMRLP